MIARVCLTMLAVAGALRAAEAPAFDYKVLATSRTSTMEKEMNEAAQAGFRFLAVMGGETGFGGSEVVVVMGKETGSGEAAARRYKLLATSRTSTMQKELQQAGEEGFEYQGQTVFSSTFGGDEVSIILEHDPNRALRRFDYRLLATSRTSTMQKELQQAAAEGYQFVGLTVGKTALRGNEVVCILRKAAE